MEPVTLPGDCLNEIIRLYLLDHSWDYFVKKILYVRSLRESFLFLKKIDESGACSIRHWITNFILVFELKRVNKNFHKYFCEWSDKNWVMDNKNLFGMNTYTTILDTLKNIANYIIFGCSIKWTSNGLRTNVTFFLSPAQKNVSISCESGYNLFGKQKTQYFDVKQVMYAKHQKIWILSIKNGKTFHKVTIFDVMNAVKIPRGFCEEGLPYSINMELGKIPISVLLLPNDCDII